MKKNNQAIKKISIFYDFDIYLLFIIYLLLYYIFYEDNT